MATGRMVHKALHSNPQVGELEIQVRYFYIGLIIHSDDDGRMKADTKFLKATIFPFDFGLRLETIQEWLRILSDAKLISLYAVGGKDYLEHPNWKKWQSIRKDRYNPSDCPPKSEMATIGQPDGNQMATQPNLTQPNLIKETEPSAVFLEADKPISSKSGMSDQLKDCLSKCEGLGFNAYACINKLKGSKKWTQEIPDQVLINVCNQYLRDKAKGVIKSEWPWFTKVFEQESQKYFANKQIEDHRKIKDQPLAIKDILSGIRGE